MSAWSYNEKRGRGQQHSGGWFSVMVVVGMLFAFFEQSAYAQQARQPLAPQPGTVTTNNVQPIGTGCPTRDSITPTISDDRLTLILTYSNFTVRDGEPVAAQTALKNCDIVLNITYPSGFRFAIFSVNFKGLASMRDVGTIGSLAARYSFQGQSPPVEFTRLGTGPFSGNYEAPLVKNPATEVMFGPCGGGGVLNIITEVRVEGTGVLSATNTDPFQQNYALIWQSC